MYFQKINCYKKIDCFKPMRGQKEGKTNEKSFEFFFFFLTMPSVDCIYQELERQNTEKINNNIQSKKKSDKNLNLN